MPKWKFACSNVPFSIITENDRFDSGNEMVLGWNNLLDKMLYVCVSDLSACKFVLCTMHTLFTSNYGWFAWTQSHLIHTTRCLIFIIFQIPMIVLHLFFVFRACMHFIHIMSDFFLYFFFVFCVCSVCFFSSAPPGSNILPLPQLSDTPHALAVHFKCVCLMIALD